MRGSGGRCMLVGALCAVGLVEPVWAAWLLDGDGDLLPDTWEATYALNPADPADADVDLDADQLTNLDEFFAGTDPVLSNITPPGIYPDNVLLRVIQGRAFRFFWEQSHPPYYFTVDYASNINPASSASLYSIAATGFQLVALVVAAEQQWLDHEVAYERIRTILERCVALQQPSLDVAGPGTTNGQKGNRHGYLYHFVTAEGTRSGESEISTVDHALLVGGALLAGEYFKGTEVETLAQQLLRNTDWNWLYDGTYLAMAWLENGGPFEDGVSILTWDHYAEQLILLLLAMGVHTEDPQQGIPASAWTNLDGFARSRLSLEPRHLGYLREFGEEPIDILSLDSPLFVHQYSHLFADFRKRRDQFNQDYFLNSRLATLVNRQFAMDLQELYPDDFESYHANAWGLSSGLRSDGYERAHPVFMDRDALRVVGLSGTSIPDRTDSGTVFPFAHLGSMPFTPSETMLMAQFLYTQWFLKIPGFYDAVWGRYGFLNAFNLGTTITGQRGHYATQVIGIDLGPIVGMLANYLTGVPWKFMMRNPFLQNGMQMAGFATSAVEPFILNFDDPPLPHEDPNGGGRDPNSFGGFSGSFGPGTHAITYLPIADPLPAEEGPQGYVQRLRTHQAGAGGFITLNGHSVSQWETLSFWIRGLVGGEEVSVGLKDVPTTQQVESQMPIADFLPSGITTTWQQVQIPLRGFRDDGVRLTALDNISFIIHSSGGGVIELDDIRFLEDTSAPAAPTDVHATTTAAGVRLEWSAPADPTVIGFNVARGTTSGGPYQQLNQTVVVARHFDDQEMPDPVFYVVEAVDNALTPNRSRYSEEVRVDPPKPPAFPPVLQPLPDQRVTVGTLLSFTVQATDANGDAVQYTADALPAGAALDASTGVFTWTPAPNQVGTYTVTFTAADPDNLTDSLTITITVANVNRPPVLASIGDQLLAEGALLTFVVTATDPDEDPITYAASSLPAGASLDAVTGRFTWTPSSGQAGNYPITFTATDPSGTSDAELITITITDTDFPPTLNPIGDQSTAEGTLLSVSLSATDPDGDPITYSVIGLPAGATLDATTGVLSWTPDVAQVGSYAVTLTATDKGGLSDSELITITVTTADASPSSVVPPTGDQTVADGGLSTGARGSLPSVLIWMPLVNQPTVDQPMVSQPTVRAPVGRQHGTEGSPLTFTMRATAPDSEPITYSAAGLPTGATRLNPTAGDFVTRTPSVTQAGASPVTLSARNPTHASDTTITPPSTIPSGTGWSRPITSYIFGSLPLILMAIFIRWIRTW